MGKFMAAICLMVIIVFFVPLYLGAAESVRLASPIRLSPHYYLPVLAGEEKGFWRENGLEVEWVPFSSDAAFHRAIAADSVRTGLALATTLVQGAGVGLPILIIAGYHPMHTWYVWVRADSKFRKPEDLKGARVGVSRLGGMEQAYGQVVATALGIRDQVKYVGAGGIRENIAILSAGHADAVVFSLSIMVKLKLAGAVRELLAVNDFLPKEWAGYFIFATQGLARENPSLVSRLVKAVLQATAFLRANPDWALERMKSYQGYTPEEAKLIQGTLNFSADGKITLEGLEHVRDFLIQNGIVSKERTPPVDVLYTERFLKY